MACKAVLRHWKQVAGHCLSLASFVSTLERRLIPCASRCECVALQSETVNMSSHCQSHVALLLSLLEFSAFLLYLSTLQAKLVQLSTIWHIKRIPVTSYLKR